MCVPCQEKKKNKTKIDTLCKCNKHTYVVLDVENLAEVAVLYGKHYWLFLIIVLELNVASRVLEQGYCNII